MTRPTCNWQAKVWTDDFCMKTQQFLGICSVSQHRLYSFSQNEIINKNRRRYVWIVVSFQPILVTETRCILLLPYAVELQIVLDDVNLLLSCLAILINEGKKSTENFFQSRVVWEWGERLLTRSLLKYIAYHISRIRHFIIDLEDSMSNNIGRPQNQQHRLNNRNAFSHFHSRYMQCYVMIRRQQ